MMLNLIGDRANWHKCDNSIITKCRHNDTIINQVVLSGSREWESKKSGTLEPEGDSARASGSDVVQTLIH